MESTFRRTQAISLRELKQGVLSGSRLSLSKSITLVESTRSDDQEKAGTLVDELLPFAGKSVRLGITGVPGVGKSTFIESFGLTLTSMGKKVAVLSIDPSSTKTRGSILGDKTRMDQLSNDHNAFVRPSAAGDQLGGVASHTREAILLCEAAGYDVIIVETVGVGQSETLVKDLVDYFLVLALAGGGDELQGIKRGIMEMADHILINKSDGDNKVSTENTAVTYQQAIRLFPENEAGWEVPVSTCSALEGKGVTEVWDHIGAYLALTEGKWLEENRIRQNIKWFQEAIKARLQQNLLEERSSSLEIQKLEQLVSTNQIGVRKAVASLFT